MSSLLRPVGPEPPAVYWRRRAALLGGLIVLVIVAVMIIKALASGGGEPGGATTTPPPSTTASPTETAAPAPEECQARNLTVVLTSTQQSYGPGSPVLLNAHITNAGAKACAVVPSVQQVQLHVVSGTDQIFETAHCADQAPPPNPEDTVMVDPGGTAILPVEWNAQRSVDRCGPVADKDQPHRARDATYRATVTINGALSDETVFNLVP